MFWFETLNTSITMPILLLQFPIFFMFHDFEEILTVESWLKKNEAHLKSSLPAFANRLVTPSMKMNTLNFATDVFWVFVIIVAVTLLAVFFSFQLLYLATLHVFFLHVFTHVGQSILLKRYTPGVITAVVLVLPYSLYAYYRLHAEHMLTSYDMGISLLLTLLLLPIALFLVLRGRKRYSRKQV